MNEKQKPKKIRGSSGRKLKKTTEEMGASNTPKAGFNQLHFAGR